jgi:hypothetical protein
VKIITAPTQQKHQHKKNKNIPHTRHLPKGKKKDVEEKELSLFL